MSRREQAMIESLAELARGDGPPPLDGEQARRMVRDAALRGRARARRSLTAWRTAVWVAAAAAVLAAAGSLALRGDREGPIAVGPAEPLQVELATGDRITAAPGARFRLESSAREARRVSVDRGAMLFDVAHLELGTSFEVVTPHLRARVLGTVFSVQATEGGTVVRVFEGRVEVLEADRARRLVDARQRTRSGSAAVSALDDGSPLAAEAWQAAAERAEPAARDEVEAGETPDREEAREPEPDVRHPPVAQEEPGVSDPDAALALIARGDARSALEAARRRGAGAPRAERARWRVVEGDALRALQRFDEAADAYERASGHLAPAEAAQAGFSAASLRFHRLDDPSGALVALERSGADAVGSPLEERSLALRARALERLGRIEEARGVARRYLDRFPGGGMAAWMAGLDP